MAGDDIYSAIFVFKKSKRNGELSAKLKIRGSKRGNQIIRNLDWVEGVNEMELGWEKRYKQHYVTTIERVDKDEYIDRHLHESVPRITSLSLERVVQDTLKEY